MSFDVEALDAAPSLPEYMSSLLPPDGSSLPSLETSLSNLVSHLQLASADASSTVSSLIDGTSQSVPALSFDIQLLKEHALMLRFSLQSVKKRVDENGHDLDTDLQDDLPARLSSLFTIQHHLSTSLEILRKADTWSSLDADVSTLLSNGQFGKAAHRLADASDTLSLFSHTSEYESRKSFLVSLQNSLEAHLVSGLVKSIARRDTANVKAVGDILREAGREDEFMSYYFGARRTDLSSSWKFAPLSDSPVTYDPNTDPSQVTLVKFSEWLPQWTSTLLNLVTDEIRLVPLIFPDPLDTFTTFLSTSFDSLAPSISQRLSDVASHHGAWVLPEFIQLYRTIEETCLAVDGHSDALKSDNSVSTGNDGGVSEGVGGDSNKPSSPIETSQGSRRRSSKRFSISRRLSIKSPIHDTTTTSTTSGEDARQSAIYQENPFSNAVPVSNDLNQPISAWETCLLEPFLEWQSEYAELESRYLQQASKSLLSELEQSLFTDKFNYNTNAKGSENQSDTSFRPRSLWEISNSHFQLADDAFGRCMTFTHGYGSAAYTEAVDSMLVRLFHKGRETLTQGSNNNTQHIATSQRSSTGHDDLFSSTSSSIESTSINLEGIDYTSESWATFRRGLRLLRTCRSISEKLTALDERVKTRISIIAPNIRNGVIIPGTTRGAIALLSQSTLNSLELQRLLDLLQVETSSSSQPVQTPGQENVSTSTEQIQRRPSLSSSSSSLNVPSASLARPRRRSSNSSTFSGYHNQYTSATTNKVPPSKDRTVVFVKARKALQELAKSCQLMIHSIILEPLLNALSGYENMSVWKSTESTGNSVNDHNRSVDLPVPTFSLSPTEPISRLSEGLFNLPRLFEVYATDEDSLSYMVESIPFANKIVGLSTNIATQLSSINDGIAEGTTMDSTDTTNSGTTVKTQRRQSLLGGSIGEDFSSTSVTPTASSTLSQSMNKSSSQQQQQQQQQNQPSPSPQLSTEQVISTWLSSLTFSIIDNYLSRHLKSLPSPLSKTGSQQLLCDLNHISNVAKVFEADDSRISIWKNAIESLLGNGNENDVNRSNNNIGGDNNNDDTPRVSENVSDDEAKIWSHVSRLMAA